MSNPDHSRPVLTAEELKVIRIAWALWDDARDRGDLAAAGSIMQGLEQRAIRLCLGNDTRLPMERLHHDPRVYAVGDAMVVVASDIDDRDRAVGDLRGQGHHLLVVEIPRVG